MILIFLFGVLLEFTPPAYAINSVPQECKNISEPLQANCQAITYDQLPKQVRSLMKKEGCKVTAKSHYNYGSSLELNDDDQREYIFCCAEKKHGPCDAKLFAKDNKKWRAIDGDEGLAGYDNQCGGLSILKEKDEGFHKICVSGNLSRPLRSFHHGEYRSDK